MKILFRMFHLEILFLAGMITLITPEEGYPHSRIGNYYQAIEDEDEEGMDGDVLCDDKQIPNYLKRLEVVSPESVIILATVQEIDMQCRTVDDKLTYINKYFNTCEPEYEKEPYKSLVKGVRALDEKLCKNSSFKEEFMKYTFCYSQLHVQYKKCSGPEDWLENKSPEFVCKTYENIANCFYQKTVKECGAAEAKTLQELVDYVITRTIQVKCNVTEKHIIKHTSELSETAPPSSTSSNRLVFYIPLAILVPVILLIIWCHVRKLFFKNVQEEKENLIECKREKT